MVDPSELQPAPPPSGGGTLSKYKWWIVGGLVVLGGGAIFLLKKKSSSTSATNSSTTPSVYELAPGTLTSGQSGYSGGSGGSALSSNITGLEQAITGLQTALGNQTTPGTGTGTTTVSQQGGPGSTLQPATTSTPTPVTPVMQTTTPTPATVNPVQYSAPGVVATPAQSTGSQLSLPAGASPAQLAAAAQQAINAYQPGGAPAGVDVGGVWVPAGQLL